MGRSAKYPYYLWADGGWHELRRGQDFDTSMPSFRAVIHEWARNNYFRLLTRDVDPNTMAVCFKRKE